MDPKKIETTDEAENTEDSETGDTDSIDDGSGHELEELFSVMRAWQKRSTRHMRQYDYHLRKLEDRVTQLEEQLANATKSMTITSTPTMKRGVDGNHARKADMEPAKPSPASNKHEAMQSDPAPINPNLNYLTREQFHTKSSSSVADVLVSSTDEPREPPERIRFNSLLVITALRHFLGMECSSHRSPTSPSKRWTIVWPFKPFAENEGKVKKGMTAFIRYLRRDLSNLHLQGVEFASGDTLSINQYNPKNQENHLNASSWGKVLVSCGMYCCLECTETICSESPTVEHTERLFGSIFELMDNHIMPLGQRFRERVVDEIRFCDLCYLFQPGDEVVTHNDPHIQDSGCLALRVLKTHGGRLQSLSECPASSRNLMFLESAGMSITKTSSPFLIDAYYLDHDGLSIIPIRQRFAIDPYAGLKRIRELELYPIEYSQDPDREALVSRGERFLTLAQNSSGAHMACRGLDLQGTNTNDEVVVDMQEYLNLHKDHTPISTAPKNLNLAEVHEYMATEAMIQDETRRLASRNVEITDKELVICNYRLHAYKLSARTWVQVHVDTLSKITPAGGVLGFDFLVLPPGHKETLRIQLENYVHKKASRPTQDIHLDVVQGKGQGLVILLHGPPGVGKTSTAECIAEMIKRPLYSITYGALGTNASEIEAHLARHLQLAAKWDCVVLLDEADLFLSKRSREDFQRNGVVVLFLRMLEYYPGILVLTTNRVGTLDEGFMSRIDIPLYYPNFDEKYTILAWETYIKKTQLMFRRNGRTDIDLDAEDIMAYLKEVMAQASWRAGRIWNGREIRNAFQAAIAIGEHELKRAAESGETRRVAIGRKQFEAVSIIMRKFDHYLYETVGGTYSHRAKVEKIRGDIGERGRYEYPELFQSKKPDESSSVWEAKRS